MNSIQKIWYQTDRRVASGLTALFCASLLLFAVGLEYFVELTPCPLCIAQRVFFGLVGLVALAGVIYPKFLQKPLLGAKIAVLSVLGGAIAGRQVWMQHHPPVTESAGCPVSFGSFVDQFLVALGGTGDCAKVDWTLLHLSIAEWSLLSFLFLFVVGGWLVWQSTRRIESL